MLMEVEEVFGGGERGLFWEDGGYGGGRCRVEREREVRRERKTLGEKWKIKALVLILTHA